MPAFYFPATLALLLRADTWLPDITVGTCIRNYGASGQQFWIKSRKPGNHHYRVRPVPGGFRVIAGSLPAMPAVTGLPAGRNITA